MYIYISKKYAYIQDKKNIYVFHALGPPSPTPMIMVPPPSPRDVGGDVDGAETGVVYVIYSKNSWECRIQ